MPSLTRECVRICWRHNIKTGIWLTNYALIVHKTEMHLMWLQLSILVDIKKVEDLGWAEVELLRQLFLANLHHQLALHQTFQLCKLHHNATLIL